MGLGIDANCKDFCYILFLLKMSFWANKKALSNAYLRPCNKTGKKYF